MPKYDRELIARMLETPAVFEDASRREQARLLREADNLEADARTVVREVPDGMVLVPARMELTPENMETLVFMLGGDPDAKDVDERWNGGTLWVGETIGDNGEKYYGLNVANVECYEEGSIPIVEFAEAPAASGAHPDALPDGTLSKSTAKRVDALAAASVSERARDYHQHDAIEFAVRDLGYSPADAARITASIEQALTQQRGEGEAVDRDAWAEALELPEGYTVEEFLPGGWHYAWTRADGERMVSGTTWNHPALAAIAAWQYAPATASPLCEECGIELGERIGALVVKS